MCDGHVFCAQKSTSHGAFQIKYRSKDLIQLESFETDPCPTFHPVHAAWNASKICSTSVNSARFSERNASSPSFPRGPRTYLSEIWEMTQDNRISHLVHNEAWGWACKLKESGCNISEQRSQEESSSNLTIVVLAATFSSSATVDSPHLSETGGKLVPSQRFVEPT